MTRRISMLALTVALAALVGWASWPPVPTRAQMGPMTGQSLEQLSGDDFDKAFLDQMSMHHAMAVVMATPVVANATHPELKGLGGSIIADQTREIAQMRAWAVAWYGLELPDHLAMMQAMSSMPMPSGNQMPMTGHEGHGGMMGGMQPGGMQGTQGMPGGMTGQMPMMADMSMMADLAKLPPARLEAVFMSMMIPHHESAVRMAQLVPDRAAHQELKDLAGQIIVSQSAEISQMNTWLSSWYGL